MRTRPHLRKPASPVPYHESRGTSTTCTYAYHDGSYGLTRCFAGTGFVACTTQSGFPTPEFVTILHCLPAYPTYINNPATPAQTPSQPPHLHSPISSPANFTQHPNPRLHNIHPRGQLDHPAETAGNDLEMAPGGVHLKADHADLPGACAGVGTKSHYRSRMFASIARRGGPSSGISRVSGSASGNNI